MPVRAEEAKAAREALDAVENAVKGFLDNPADTGRITNLGVVEGKLTRIRRALDTLETMEGDKATEEEKQKENEGGEETSSRSRRSRASSES